jgi:hypothetical protein
LKTEVNRILPNMKYPAYFGALAEHESCVSLTSSRCWSPTSELSTSRELGRGLFQLTKAYTADGKLRFDTLQEMKDKHKSELKELSWDNIKQRPDLQMRAMLLQTKGNLNSLIVVEDEWERLAMADAAYNGGLAGLKKERQACALAKGCDPQYWFNNIENKCLKSTKALYGQRSACDINRHHVRDILTTRYNKYIPYLGG